MHREACLSWMDAQQVAVKISIASGDTDVCFDDRNNHEESHLFMGKSFVRSLILTVGSLLNPYSGRGGHKTEGCAPLSFLTATQCLDILDAVAQSSSTEWTECVTTVIADLVLVAENCVLAIEEALRLEKSGSGQQQTLELSGSSDINSLIGLFAVSGGFNGPLSTGSKVIRRGANGSLKEEYIVQSCDENEPYEEAFVVCPTSGGDVETVFDSVLLSERVPRSVSPSICSGWGADSLIAVQLLSRIFQADASDTRPPNTAPAAKRSRVEVNVESPHPVSHISQRLVTAIFSKATCMLNNLLLCYIL